MAGIAPWLDLDEGPADERALRTRYRDLTARALAQALDPASPDALNFTDGGQPLVDAAFLAQAVLRAPQVLQQRPRAGDARAARRGLRIGARHPARLQQLAAVCGDGRSRAQGARRALGPHARGLRAAAARAVVSRRRRVQRRPGVPLGLLQQLRDPPDAGRRAGARCGDVHPAWTALRTKEEARATRYAAVLERLVAPDGSFPPLGRSIAYRCGAFQALAQAALRRTLPADVPPAQAPRGPDRRDRARARRAEHVRRQRLADDRVCRPPARHRRAVHLHRQPVSLRDGAAAAGIAARPIRSGPTRRSRGLPSARGRGRGFRLITPLRIDDCRLQIVDYADCCRAWSQRRSQSNRQSNGFSICNLQSAICNCKMACMCKQAIRIVCALVAVGVMAGCGQLRPTGRPR